ncbi:telomere-protecting terminal protein Tpg [Streptomyces virginiae]
MGAAVRRPATSTGITVETRARFGYTAPVGTTDVGRVRRLTVRLPAVCAQRLFEARVRGAADRDLRAIVAEGLREIYFKDGGSRADQLRVVPADESEAMLQRRPDTVAVSVSKAGADVHLDHAPWDASTYQQHGALRLRGAGAHCRGIRSPFR